MTRKKTTGLDNPTTPHVEDESHVTEMVQGPDGTFEKKEKSKGAITEATKSPKEDLKENLGIDTGLVKAGELTPEQVSKKEELKASIDINDTMSIIEYGAEEQGELKTTIETLTKSSKTRELQVIGKEIMDLNSRLRTQGQSEASSVAVKIFRSLKEKVLSKRDGAVSLESNITAIEEKISEHVGILSEDIGSLEDLWEINKNRFYELELLRIAGLEKIEELKLLIEQKTKEFEESDGKLDEMEKQELQKMYNALNLLEKKIHDLHTSQIIAVQTAQEIQMIKGCDIKLKELMQETVITAIPVWRMQGALNIAVRDAQFVADMHRSVNEATNKILVGNAELLGTLTRDVATEAEKPVVETETLVQVYNIIGKTLTDIVGIAIEGDRRRAEGKKKLEELEKKLISTGAPKQIKGK